MPNADWLVVVDYKVFLSIFPSKLKGYMHVPGQRKYGGPPPGWEGGTPGAGCEVFCGKIPKDMYEDELIPLFERCGTIWDLRLMMDPMTGTNRGYAFVTFTTREATQHAVQEVRPPAGTMPLDVATDTSLVPILLPAA